MAGIPDKFWTKKLKPYSYTKTEKGYRVNLELGIVGEKLDAAQDALDAQVWIDAQKYMPVETGELKNKTNVLNTVERQRGKVFMYPPDSKYGHYQYEGRTMVDPVTGSPFARKGVTKVYVKEYEGKVPTKAPEYLTYSQPDAVAHWGEEAIKNHLKEWFRLVEKVVKE